MNNVFFYLFTSLSIVLGVVTCIKKSFRYRTGFEATGLEAIVIGMALILIGVVGIVIALFKRQNTK